MVGQYWKKAGYWNEKCRSYFKKAAQECPINIGDGIFKWEQYSSKWNGPCEDEFPALANGFSSSPLRP